MPSPVEVLHEHYYYHYVICVLLLLLRLEAEAQHPETQEYRDGLEAADWTRH